MENKGFEKVELVFGAEGILKCFEKNYRLVICHDALPEMTETGLILRIKFNSRMNDTKFLVLTTKNEEEYYLRQIPLDRVSYDTSNPINFDIFEENIEELVIN